MIEPRRGQVVNPHIVVPPPVAKPTPPWESERPSAPYRVETITDSHGTYQERWMVPPPGEGVVFQVTAEAWVTEPCDRCGGRGFVMAQIRPHLAHCPNCVNGRRRVRVIHEWKAVEPRREL